MQNMDKDQNYHAQWKEPDQKKTKTKTQYILHNSIYTKF